MGRAFEYRKSTQIEKDGVIWPVRLPESEKIDIAVKSRWPRPSKQYPSSYSDSECQG